MKCSRWSFDYFGEQRMTAAEKKLASQVFVHQLFVSCFRRDVIEHIFLEGNKKVHN